MRIVYEGCLLLEGSQGTMCNAACPDPAAAVEVQELSLVFTAPPQVLAGHHIRAALLSMPVEASPLRNTSSPPQWHHSLAATADRLVSMSLPAAALLPAISGTSVHSITS